MPSDLSFIPDTAQTDADIFFVKSLCHRLRNGSLTSSRRSYQTEDRTFSALCQLSHRKKFHDPFFDLFQSVMPFFKDFPCFCQIIRILRTAVPGKRQKCFNISSKYRTFCRAAAHGAVTADLLCKLFLYFRRSIQLFQFFPILIRHIGNTFFSKFLTDQL